MKFLIMAALLSGLTAAPAVEIIGHRGASHDAPENTLAAFRLGYEQGADACELDIHLTRDGRVVVSHDATTQRTTGQDRSIAQSTLAELAGLEAGQWGKWRGSAYHEPVPLLEDVLKLVPAGRKLVIEIKCGAEVLPELERVLTHGPVPPERLVLIGFDYETMRAAKARLPRIAALWLASSDKETKQFPAVEQLIRRAREAKLDGLDLAAGFPMDAGFVRKVHEAGLQLYTWTVDDPTVARAEMKAGVDGITTNRPRWLREELAARPK